jgi:hypothetical protein
MWEKRNACRVLVGKPEGKIQLGRPRHRWKYNIETGLKYIELEGVDWINLAQDGDKLWALINMVMNPQAP